jgi:hypothetical protein
VSAERVVRCALWYGINEDGHGNAVTQVIVTNADILPLPVILRNLLSREAANARREAKLRWCVGADLCAAWRGGATAAGGISGDASCEKAQASHTDDYLNLAHKW